MGDSLIELQRHVYRRSISRDIGVIEAIDEFLADVSDEEERQRLGWLRAVIEAYRKHHRVAARRHGGL